jgi:hypothetical protein
MRLDEDTRASEIDAPIVRPFRDARCSKKSDPPGPVLASVLGDHRRACAMRDRWMRRCQPTLAARLGRPRAAMPVSRVASARPRAQEETELVRDKI